MLRYREVHNALDLVRMLARRMIEHLYLIHNDALGRAPLLMTTLAAGEDDFHIIVKICQ